MRRVKELERAVVSLPEQDYDQFLHWFLERDWEKWNNQIEADSKTGRLDFLIKEAIQDKEQNKLKNL